MTMEPAAFMEALHKCHDNLRQAIADLHFLTVAAPHDAQWDQVRDEVSVLDSIADVMRQVLDARSGSASADGG
ncbi:MAG: hypothetical protein LAP85_27420 [Acidobacteriia bacterium]|nr:hypothetical protein [Terriglobia bacterium]